MPVSFAISRKVSDWEVFVPSTMDMLGQLWHNSFRCIPRNTDIVITAGGKYMYCYNDITHKHTLGSISEMSIRKAIESREKTGPIPEICDTCNMRERYKAGEFLKVMAKHIKNKMLG
ncbi:MAG: hypothetical protein IMF07_03715 [Proteobacteria bacterium]|nr:hypothetical protein [Pseudomonadota bacterium]